MKHYTTKELAQSRHITDTSARALIKRHGMGQKYGQTYILTEKEYKYLVGIVRKNVTKV